MADIPASNWSETDASNTTAAPDGAPEGMAPSGVNDVLRAHQGAIKRWYDWSIPKTTGGTSTAYTLSYTVAPGALVDGMTHVVRFNAANGAAPTLNVNALGATPLYTFQAGAWAAVSAAGVIQADQISRAVYNSSAGAYFLLDVGEGFGNYCVVKSGSAANNIDFTDIPAGVNHIEIDVALVPGTDGANIVLQTYGADGVLDTGSNDYYYLLKALFSDTTESTTALTTSSILLGGSVDNGAVGFSARISAQGIQASTWTKFNVQSEFLDAAGVLAVSVVGGGARGEADRITGVRIKASSGTITYKATLRGRP